MIADFLAALDDAFGFDRALARRVREELADHLYEAVAADPDADRAAAEQRAVAACGDPGALASEFAEIAQVQRARRLGPATVAASVGVLLAMKARVAWYAASGWRAGASAAAAARIVLPIDTAAFWAALLMAVAGCIAAGRLGGPSRIGWNPRPGIRWVRRLAATAAAGLLVAVASDGVLTALRLSDGVTIAVAAVPVASVAAELAGAAVVLALVRQLGRGARGDGCRHQPRHPPRQPGHPAV